MPDTRPDMRMGDGTGEHEESGNWNDGHLVETTKGHDLVYSVRQ